MNFFNVLTLFGGLAMFLYGMRLMGDGLKESSSGTLKQVMENVTNNVFKAFLLGAAVTALIQSSTATIVITSGLVGAGLLTLRQSLGIIIGANVGTTVTGQIIRLLDMNAEGGSWLQIFKPSSLAPIALIIGIVMIMGMGNRVRNARQIGNIAIGFGILFSGLLNMTSAVSTLTESPLVQDLFAGIGNNPLIGYLTGAGVAFVLQSSSATIGILQAFSSSGLLIWHGTYPVIAGVYLGDCVTTAIVCSIGAKADAQRVGIVNILYNLCKTLVTIVAVTIAHRAGLLDGIWNQTMNSSLIANTNTIFNLGCALVLIPVLPFLEKMSRRIVKDEPVKANKYQDKLDALNPVFFSTPALALNSCYDLLMTQLQLAKSNISRAYKLLYDFDEAVYQDIQDEEVNIDLFADRISGYLVALLPHLKDEVHVSILDQYYKVVSEFERLGDHAVNIAENAQSMAERKVAFSELAARELDVLQALLEKILADTELAFGKRNIEAAYRIQPLRKVAADLASDLKDSHLARMSRGECNVFLDPNFENLLSDMIRIADVSSNVGEAVVVRARPELASREHGYFRDLRHEDEEYRKTYTKYRDTYFAMLPAASGSLGAATGGMPDFNDA
ncbi:MAG: Na/Pi cotransporter family protein [Lachnospiraceae bacterium]|nr:Na/Pi cotransporter family protein [Lachnospiraceae bacterium]